MATIIITVPAAEASDFVAQVADQLRDGYTSGHKDSERYWDADAGDGEHTDDLR